MSFLKSKYDEVSEAVEKYSKYTNDFMAIKKFMKSRVENIKLTEAQQEIYNRLQFIYNQLVSGKYSEQQIVHMLTNEPYNLKRSQAYYDIQTCKDLFSTARPLDKQFLLKLNYERLEIQMRKASEANNLDVYAKLQKNMLELLKMMPDEELEVPEDYVPTLVVPMYDPRLLGIKTVDAQKLAELKATLKKQFNFNLDFIPDAEESSS